MNKDMRSALNLLIEKWERRDEAEAGHPDTEEGHILNARSSGFDLGKEQCSRELRQFLALLDG